MIKSNPFTPQTGWEPRVFAGRARQIESFKRILSEAAGGIPNHMLLLGQWGMGKTSILKQFKKIAQAQGYLASFCSIGKFTDKDDLQDGIKLITEEMTRGLPKIKGVKNIFDLVESFGISFGGFGAQLSRKKDGLQPQTYLTEFLLEMWRQLNNKLIVVLLDDIQNFSAISQIIDIIRLVLSKEEVTKNTRYLFVLASTPAEWGDFLDKHDPVGRFFRKKESLDPLSAEETLRFINETLFGTEVSFSRIIKEKIYEVTEGHPYEVQLLCSNLYEAQLQKKVGRAEWDQAFDNTIRELGRDYFDMIHRRVSDREDTVLRVLAENGSEADIQKTITLIKDKQDNFPYKNVKNYLYRLEKKGILVRTEKKKFKIFDQMFKEYLIRKQCI